MLKKKYLLCPQCGAHRYYLDQNGAERVCFHVDHDGEPFPTEESGAGLKGLDFPPSHAVAAPGPEGSANW